MTQPTDQGPEASVEDVYRINSDIEGDAHQFRAGAGIYRDDHISLYARITDAWKDMRASTRRLINEKPSEARLLFYVLLSDLIFFLSSAVKTVVAPNSIVESVIPDDVSLMLVVALLARTGVIYVFSIILGLFLRLLGGKGTLKDTRTGIFWGSFVSAPFGILSAALAVGMNALDETLPFLQNETLALAPLWVGLLPYVWFVSAGATEAHQFKKSFPLFAGLSLLCVVGLIYAMYLRAKGVI